MEQWIEPLKWVGSVVVATLGLFGLGKLLENWQTRRYVKEDRYVQIHDATEAKKIEASAEAFSIISKRLAILESDLKELNEKVSLEMQKSARLDAENAALKKDNVRLDLEVNGLRKRVHDLSNEIGHRDLKIARLEAAMTALNGG